MFKLKISVAGAGSIGKTHIKLITESEQCELGSIIDPSPDAHLIGAQYGVKVYPSLEEAFEHDKPDGVVLATPNRLHANQAHLCIAENVPVIVEKPLTDSIEQAIELYKHSQQSEAKILVGHHRAYSPILSIAKSIIDSGQLGALVTVTGSATFYKPDDYFDEGLWRTKRGGGPILINMIHEIGNLRHLVGEITGVQALSSNHARKFEVEDTTVISIRFANGALGSFVLSDACASPRSWEQTSQEDKSYATYVAEDCYHIAGNKGSISIPTMRVSRFEEGVTPSWWNEMTQSHVVIEREDPLKLQLAHFCALIVGEENVPKVSVWDGLQNLLVVDAILKACESEQYVPVEDIKPIIG